MNLRAPFVWFGGKSQAAELIWSRLGDVDVYVEPFFGSGAVLLGRPHRARVETVNDIDGMVANAWRAIIADPLAVAEHASWPVFEVDLHARHLWLVEQLKDGFAERLMADPELYDAKIAGWWLWGMAAWIGGHFCSGEGPWSKSEDGRLAKVNGANGIKRRRPHLSNDGQGVNKPSIKRKIPHLHDDGQGVNKPSIKRKIPHLSNRGQGVNRPSIKRQIPHLHDDGRGVNRPDLGGDKRSPDIVSPGLVDWLHDLAERLRWVRVCCGDWTRVMGPSVTSKHLAVIRNGGACCGVVLDPPYSHDERAQVYRYDHDVSADVRAWAIKHGDDPKLRIALCGYDGDGNDVLADAGWRAEEWFKQTLLSGGYGKQGDGGQQHRERVWFSPHCLQPIKVAQGDLFDVVVAG